MCYKFLFVFGHIQKNLLHSFSTMVYPLPDRSFDNAHALFEDQRGSSYQCHNIQYVSDQLLEIEGKVQALPIIGMTEEKLAIASVELEDLFVSLGQFRQNLVASSMRFSLSLFAGLLLIHTILCLRVTLARTNINMRLGYMEPIFMEAVGIDIENLFG